jgi:hypothetical protein
MGDQAKPVSKSNKTVTLIITAFMAIYGIISMALAISAFAEY